MAKYTMDMVLQYAKVFEDNRDMGENNDSAAAKKAAKHNGKYSIDAYFTSEDQITELLQGGMQPENAGHPRVKEGEDFGIGKYIKIARFHDHKMTFTDKSGKETEVDFGGAPKVVNLTNGVENKDWWSFQNDGALGHGTKAKVQFETYSNGTGLRLIAVGVTDHVAFEDTSGPSEDDKLFMVG